MLMQKRAAKQAHQEAMVEEEAMVEAVRAAETLAAAHRVVMRARALMEILPHPEVMAAPAAMVADQLMAATQVQEVMVPPAEMRDQIQTMDLRTLLQEMVVQEATVEAQQTLARAEKVEPGRMAVKPALNPTTEKPMLMVVPVVMVEKVARLMAAAMTAV
jgi:hypothetical protein